MDAIQPKKTQDFVNIASADTQPMVINEASFYNQPAHAKALAILNPSKKGK